MSTTQWQLVMVATGGAIGALLRYGFSVLANHYWGPTFPWGTLGVNLIGSFIIGFLWQWFEQFGIAPIVRTFLFIGVLGAFTTFSTYSLDSLRLLQTGKLQLGVLNIVSNNLFGILAAFLGFTLAKQFAPVFK